MAPVASAATHENVTRRPAPALRPYVGSYSGYRHGGLPPGVHAGLPGRSLTFIVTFDEPLSMTWHDGGTVRSAQLWSLVAGLHDAPVSVHHDGRQHGIQLDLTPLGCRALFGLPAAALAHETVDLADLLGPTGDELVERLAAARGWAARFAVLDEVLARMVRQHELRPELGRAWSLIDAADGAVGVAGVADDVGWSRRHLLNQFRAEFGLAPKVMAQIMRFDRANRLLRDPASEVTIGLVAAASGYADQAHLNRDFIRFAGSPPSVWRDDPLLFPSVQDDAGGSGR